MLALYTASTLHLAAWKQLTIHSKDYVERTALFSTWLRWTVHMRLAELRCLLARMSPWIWVCFGLRRCLVIFRFYVLGPTRFRPEPGSNLISTTVTMLNKILFGLLKFYFTLNTGRKKFLYNILLHIPILKKISILELSKNMQAYVVLLYFTVYYFTLLWVTVATHTILHYAILSMV